MNLQLESTETYAVVGLNGSGKTTLIKLLVGLYSPSSGEILVDGTPLQNFNQDSIFQNISAVFQDFIQYPFDVKTNIGVGAPEKMGDIPGIQRAAKLTGADTFIAIPL